ncbi:putative protein kinase, putative,mitogen-activated protein kinase [Trypanosoma grayi]|uniref:putative protein kinase, putative,mitogen-activated protein kinase n=1 Tax=Trypanosoma grayi TaxID=71804 RepID=UPI0004F46F40|nr:putative protein kinase, putative,mitogen-activated protein kinase [Trypanosoma grayi]KEG10293.1 putative protein kinase, putative,mitogen-activated protein kinase [Trypanosoma grayi]
MASFSIDGRIEQRYKILRHIGSGAYGVVWCALDRLTHTQVALKKVFDAFGNQQDAQRTYREVMLLDNLRHESIVGLKNVIRSVNDTDLYLVFELVETDLTTILRHKVVEPVHRRYLAYQVVKVVAYLHSRGVIHRDLKPANVFVNSDCRIKLGDFGLARCLHARDSADASDDLTDYIATRWYRSPEVLVKSSTYTTAMDMWAVGCIIAELHTASPLFMGNSTLHQLSIIISAVGEPNAEDVDSLGSEEAWPLVDALPVIESDPLQDQLSQYDQEAVDLICKLIVFNPKKRLTAREVLEHPYFAPFVTEKDLEEDKKSDPLALPLPDDKDYPAAQYREALYDAIAHRFRRSIGV